MLGRIFIVDDEKIIVDTLVAILRGCGYDALAFYDAESALAACDKQAPEFVISDVCMPGMNGIEMAVELKGRFPRCGVLLFSGQAGSADLLEAAHEMGYDFELLLKPVHPKDLLAKLDGASRRPVSSNAAQHGANAIATGD
jgi:DNA-binding NtrC family response regulator